MNPTPPPPLLGCPLYRRVHPADVAEVVMYVTVNAAGVTTRLVYTYRCALCEEQHRYIVIGGSTAGVVTRFLIEHGVTRVITRQVGPVRAPDITEDEIAAFAAADFTATDFTATDPTATDPTPPQEP